MKERRFDAVLFDIDGTVLDTQDFLHQAFNHSIQFHLEKTVTWEEVTAILGLHLREGYQTLTGLQEVDHLMETHHQFQYQNLDLVAFYPNTLPTLKMLKKAGVKIGAITSRTGDQLRKSLELAGVDKFFKVIVTSDDVQKAKPDPESVYKSLELLKVQANRAIVIGDSFADILAGQNAQVKTIGARYGYGGQKMLDTSPDYLIDDIGQIIPIILG